MSEWQGCDEYGYWIGATSKNVDDEPEWKVVESPKSKRERIKNETQQKGKGKGKGKKEVTDSAVNTNDEYEYVRVEGMIDLGAFDTSAPWSWSEEMRSERQKCQRMEPHTVQALDQKLKTKDEPR